MLKYFLLVVFCITVSAAFGQDVFKGAVYEVKTHIPIGGVEVQNMNNKAVITTDDKGNFSINAKKGDLLVLKSLSYATDTVLVTSLLQEIDLVPRSNMLQEVKVHNDTTTRFNHYYDPQFHGQHVVYQRDDTLGYKGGIAFRFSDSHSSEKKHAKLEKELSDQKTQDEIDKIFSPESLGKYLPLKGEDLKGFSALYSPTPEVYKQPGFSLLIYLNDCYKKFQALPQDQRHPAAANDLLTTQP